MPASKTKGQCAGNTPNTLILANSRRRSIDLELHFLHFFTVYSTDGDGMSQLIRRYRNACLSGVQISCSRIIQSERVSKVQDHTYQTTKWPETRHADRIAQCIIYRIPRHTQ